MTSFELCGSRANWCGRSLMWTLLCGYLLWTLWSARPIVNRWRSSGGSCCCGRSCWPCCRSSCARCLILLCKIFEHQIWWWCGRSLCCIGICVGVGGFSLSIPLRNAAIIIHWVINIRIAAIIWCVTIVWSTVIHCVIARSSIRVVIIVVPKVI